MLVRHDQQLQHIGRTVAAAQQGVGSDTAKALLRHAPQLSAEEIVRAGLEVAGEVCIYTNGSVHVESVEAKA